MRRFSLCITLCCALFFVCASLWTSPTAADTVDGGTTISALFSAPSKDAPAAENSNRVVVLFAQGWSEGARALGHVIASRWDVTVETRLLAEYNREDAEARAVVVVNPADLTLPDLLIEDLDQLAQRGLVWFGGGIETLGLANSTRRDPPPRVDEVLYKGVPVRLDFEITRDIGAIASMESAEVVAIAKTVGNSYLPLIVHLSGEKNLLVVATDGPPTWYGADGWSLLFVDSLHRILGQAPGVSEKLALVRLEDVNAETYFSPDQLRDSFDFLDQRNVPFHIALIPKYVNPNTGLERTIADARRLAFELREAVERKDAILIQHGYTHQLRDEISGIGFEFWDWERSAPVEGETHDYFLDRIERARVETVRAGLPEPDIWETPHYAYSPLANEVLNQEYAIRYEPAQKIGSLPFPIEVDGTIHIPETLGYVKAASDIEAIEARLSLLSVLEEPVVASFFWHPWRELHELEHLVTAIEAEGFRFVNAYDLVDQLTPPSWERPDESAVRAMITLTWACLAIFVFGTSVHFARRYKLIRHVAASKQFKAPGLDEIQSRANAALPSFAILVPAREETRVIRNTIDSLERLDYPRSLLRIVVITDAREEPDPELGKTTYDIAMERAEEINSELGCRFMAGSEFVRVALVPDWYSGVLGQSDQTYARSTKGRALNWALEWMQNDPDLRDVQFIGIVDADGRLNPQVLREAASKIVDGARLLQGPVLQISNISNVTPVGMLAGLELANYHYTSLANDRSFSGFPKFLAGTNYFVEKSAMVAVGGWDQTALVEDADLAVRLYETCGLKLDWLWSPEVEQTAPNFSIYKRQRERWVRGHLVLIKPIMRSKLPLSARAYLLGKIVSSQFRFLFDIAFPILALALFIGGYMADISGAISWLSLFLLVGALLIWDSYGFTYRQISQLDPSGKMESKRLRASFICYLLFLPYIFIQTLPRLEAVWNFATSRAMDWYKTERSYET